ncbi:MAG TPA: class I SAM-dependent methyltransferase [Thermomicrobiales bacterium]|nr:class I SAM-dependent methyltransferase [Thermomicrobiales bacterium]
MKSEYYGEYYEHENNHWWFKWRFDMITEIVEALPRNESFRLLDAGCGTGQMTKLLEKYGDAVGLELAPEAIAFARKRGVQNIVQGSITDPPFPAGSFDLVLSLDVIEHVDNDVQILESLFEIVKPGGHLIVTVPAFQSLWSQHDEINQHKRRYRVPQLRKMIENAGFQTTKVTYCNTSLFVPVFATRKAKTALRSLRHANDIEHPESDLAFYPKPINELLYKIVSSETKLMKHVDMPFGVSILAVAQRPVDSLVESEPVTTQPISTLVSEPVPNGALVP